MAEQLTPPVPSPDPDAQATAPSAEAEAHHRSIASMSAAGDAAMTQRQLIPLLLKLKWVLWIRSLKGNIPKIIGTVFSALYGAFLMTMVGITIVSVALVAPEPEVFIAMVKGAGVVLTVLWLIGTVFMFGVDDLLSPSTLSILPRRARELQPGMAVASVVGIGAALTLIGVIFVAVVTALWLIFTQGLGSPATFVALLTVVPCFLAGTVFALLLPRAVASQMASVAISRKVKEIIPVVLVLGFLAVTYGLSLVVESLWDALAIYGPVLLDILCWTPLGALFAAPLDIAEGRWLIGFARIAIGALSLAALWLWWRHTLALALTSALIGESSSGNAKVTPLIPAWAPKNAVGASIGKSLRYWVRDSRYISALALYPILLVFLGAATALGAISGSVSLSMLLFLSALGGISVCNEIGFDGPSGWVNITAGAPGRTILAGKAIAMMVVEIPALLIAAVVFPLLSDRATDIPAIILIIIGGLLSATATSLLVSVLLPYRTSPPGVNPMQDKSASSGAAMLTMFVALVCSGIALLPVLILATIGIVRDSGALLMTAGVVGLVIGIVLIVAGVLLGGKILDRSYASVFQKVKDFV